MLGHALPSCTCVSDTLQGAEPSATYSTCKGLYAAHASRHTCLRVAHWVQHGAHELRPHLVMGEPATGAKAVAFDHDARLSMWRPARATGRESRA